MIINNLNGVPSRRLGTLNSKNNSIETHLQVRSKNLEQQCSRQLSSLFDVAQVRLALAQRRHHRQGRVRQH